MVADEPLDATSLATAVGYPVDDVVAALQRAGRGVRRAGPRLRAAQRRRRLPLLHPRGVRLGRRGLRARGAAGPAHPGRAGDARRGRLQAAGLAGPGLGDPRRQRRRRHAHPAHPWPGRGGRPGRVVGRDPVPHHELLPGADRRDHDRRAARAGALPPRPGRPRRLRGGPRTQPPTRRPRRGRAPSPTAAPSPRDRRPGSTTTGSSGCRSCSPRPGSPRAASARS